MLGTVSDELIKMRRAVKSIQPLRDRIESDFSLLRNETFKIPAKEGKWDSFTSNKAATDAYNAMHTLSDGDVLLSIPIDNNAMVERDIISNTERFVYGAIALSDSFNKTTPESLPLHQALCFQAPIRGWIAVRCYIYEEDGKLVPDIATWDMLKISWISGNRGLLRVYYEQMVNVDDVKDQYDEEIKKQKIDVKGDDDGKVKIIITYDKEEEGVFLETEGGDGKWLKKTEHGLDHIPVLILPTGSTPLVQSTKFTDTIKNVGESWAVNNRHIYEVANRMGAYFLTLVGKQVKTPKAVPYDSTLNPTPPEFDKDPSQKGAWVPIDIGKGQQIPTNMDETELTRDAYAFQQHINGLLATGGMSPLDFGISNDAGPAAGLNILRHASQIKLNPFVHAIEKTYEWIADELVSQAKTVKGFEKMELRGVDGQHNTFQIEVTPDSIEDSWNFKCELILDMPQDEAANMGMAQMAVQAELLSRLEARDKYHLTPDPGAAQDKIDMEKVANAADLPFKRAAVQFDEDGDLVGLQSMLDFLEEQKLARESASQAAQQKKVANQPGIGSQPSPAADTTAVGPATTIQRMTQTGGGG